MKLGLVLEAYRKEQALTYRELAKEIGMDHTLLFRISQKNELNSCSILILLQWLLGSNKNKS